MADWGEKISKDGSDVLTALDKDLVFSTKYNGMKILAHNTKATSGNLAHGAGYTPSFLNYNLVNGRYRLESSLYNLASGASYANGTNVNFVGPDNYYFIFVDRLAGSTAADAPGAIDWGMKISKAGVNVLTANKDQLIMSSKYPMFKISTQGSTNLKMHKTTLSGGINGVTTTIPLTSTTGIPSGLTGTMYIWVFRGAPNFDWEAISYTTVGGANVSGGVRDYKNNLGGGVAHNAGEVVVVGYNEVSIPHGLAYPPVHWVYQDGNSYGGKTMIPAVYDEFAVVFTDSGVNSSDLLITVQYDDFNVIAVTPAGTFDQWDFLYTIMLDSITTPYY